LAKYTNPKNQDTVESNITDEQAAAVLAGDKGKSDFPRDLAAKQSQYGWSPAQAYWGHMLAQERIEKGAKVPTEKVTDDFDAPTPAAEKPTPDDIPF
jgi:hypothetical protein